jgi:LacI family transcriptional regulator, galactose operon repressor
VDGGAADGASDSVKGRGRVQEQDAGDAGPGAAAERVTLSEVAARAGVSRAAASLALRGKPGVAQGTRQHILDIAGGLGYRVRSFGAQPVAGTVGLLVKAKPADAGSTNAFYAPVIAGISRACAELDLDLRLDSLAVDEDLNPIEVPRMIQSGDIDGLIILGAFLSAPTTALVGAQPLVLVDGYAEDRTALPSVLSDNAGGTARATHYLVELGHRRIAMVGSLPTSFPSILERRQGYTSAMAQAGLEPLYVDTPHDQPLLCLDPVARLLSGDRPPTALVASNDAVALTLLSQLDVDVPGRVSLVGFDDIEATGLVRPRLTTVAIDKQAMGQMAVSLLRHRIAYPDHPVFTHVQHARLVVRESAAPPRG